MIKIGITGNLGSGKTTFSNFFKKDSYIFNADKEAKKHLKNHSVLQRKLINIFGKKVQEGAKIDFKKLGQIAFENPKNQKILNGIIWPEVSVLISDAINEAKKEKVKYFIVDAALLYEANFQHFFDYIILVTADKDKRLTRAVKRRNLDLSQIKMRMALQMSDKEKKDSSNFIVYNNKSKSELENQFNDLIKKII